MAAQVDVQLPVREALRCLMRPVQRQRRLTHAGCPGYCRYHDRAAAGFHPEEKLRKRVQLTRPADEARYSRWQLPRHG